MSTTILGYAIEETGDDRAPYILRGPRGGIYGLMRHRDHPDFPGMRRPLLYAINLSPHSKGTVVALKGNYTFSDADGELTCWYPHAGSNTPPPDGHPAPRQNRGTP